MSTKIEIDYAALANASYFDTRDKDQNTPIIPKDWTQLDRTQFGLPPGPSRSGFSVEVFKKGTGIVIAYEGTSSDSVGADGRADRAINGLLGIGWAEKQLKQAALLYQNLEATNPAVDMTRTGHALGGGGYTSDRNQTVSARNVTKCRRLESRMDRTSQAYIGLEALVDKGFERGMP